MAKTRTIEEGAEAPNVEMEAPETVAKDEAPIPAEEKTPKTVSATTAKKVKIRIMEPVNSIIAGVPYNFTKDQSVSVPADVAAILVTSRKAYRI